MKVNIKKHYNYLSEEVQERYNVGRVLLEPRVEPVTNVAGVDLYEIKEVEGYLVDLDKGRVYNTRSGRYLKSVTNDPRGYVKVRIYGKGYGLHQIVVSVALGITINEFREYDLMVDHFSGKKEDNSYKNLRVVDASHNGLNARREGKVTEEDVREIRKYYRLVKSYNKGVAYLKRVEGNIKDQEKYDKVLRIVLSDVNQKYRNKDSYIAHVCKKYKMSYGAVRGIIEGKTHKDVV